MNQVLLTVSGEIDPAIDANVKKGERPQADFVALAHAFGADIIDCSAARRQLGWFGRFIEKIAGPNIMLAWACFCLRRYYRVIFTDGEQIGIPLAALMKFRGGRARPRHLMIAHLLSVRKKTLLLDWLKLYSHIDLFFVYSSWQQKFIRSRWDVPSENVVYTPFMVDADFFAPEHANGKVPVENDVKEQPVICSVGLEFRDYPTLLKAVRDLDVQVIIAAASPWSKRADSTKGQALPKNVIVRRFSQYELRDLYAHSQFVVMPLYPVDFQAGVTTILEAMAMGKAVICSKTQGQTDVVVEGETGIYVPPNDPAALREAILFLLAYPEEADRMGKHGRERILQEMSLKKYVERLASYVVCRPSTPLD